MAVKLEVYHHGVEVWALGEGTEDSVCLARSQKELGELIVELFKIATAEAGMNDAVKVMDEAEIFPW